VALSPRFQPSQGVRKASFDDTAIRVAGYPVACSFKETKAPNSAVVFTPSVQFSFDAAPLPFLASLSILVVTPYDVA
jgi:hypothetical protein